MATIIEQLQNMWSTMNPCKGFTSEFERLLEEADRLADTANANDLKLFEEFQDMMDSDTREFILNNYC